jgi:RimJ/RimL family protein N-acetyltransferase
MMDDLKANISRDGYGFTALEIKQTAECIGFCGLADAHAEEGLKTGGVEIGWRLAPQYWGKGYATEAAKRLLRFGFEELALEEIISFAVKGNQKSFAIMERLGMKHDKANDFDHTRVPDTHPHLKSHLYYFIKNPNKKGG